MASKLSDEQWAEVIRLHDGGMSSIAIGRKFGLDPRNVLRGIAARQQNAASKATLDTIADFTAHAKRFLDDYSPFPEVPERIRTNRLEDMGFSTPQPAIVAFSDLHYGSRIDPRVTGGLAEYDIDIARERLARYRDGILRFAQMDSVLIDIPALHMFALGDDIEGHGRIFQSQAFQLDESAMFQYMGFVEDVSRLLLSLLERFPHITVYKVYGNHGRIAASHREAYGPDNLELMAWEHIADRVRQQTGGAWRYTRTGIHALEGGLIDFYISRAFFMIARIAGKIHYLRHGHMIGGINKTYRGAYDNKLRMNSILGYTIPYMWKAHLHEAQEMEGEIGGQVIQNSCFVGPSLLSVEMQAAAASIPSQEMYLAHPRYGLTHHHRIRLADEQEIRQSEIIDALLAQGGELIG